jgi:hypothetical protein
MKAWELVDRQHKAKPGPNQLIFPEEEAEMEDSYVNEDEDDDEDGALAIAVMLLQTIGNWLDKITDEGVNGQWLSGDDIKDACHMSDEIFNFLKDHDETLVFVDEEYGEDEKGSGGDGNSGYGHGVCQILPTQPVGWNGKLDI